MPEPRAVTQFVPPDTFVRSYDPPIDVDPWTFVQRYREAQTRFARNPTQSSAAIAEAVGLPSNRLDDWFGRGEEPTIISDLGIANRHGWIGVDPTTEIFRGLNVLVASTLATGSIHQEMYEPHFAVRSSRDIERIAWAIDRVGLRYAMVRDSEEERAREIRPRRHGAVLGRVLVALGADKTTGLPSYLSQVSRDHRLAFARTYLGCQITQGGSQEPVTIGNDRHPQFLDDVATLLTDLTGGSISRKDRRLVIPADAAHSLGTVL